MMQTKACYKCGPAPQPLENFANDRSARDGRDQLCRHHRRMVQHEWRTRHREQERLRAADYRARANTLPLPPAIIQPHHVVAWQGTRYRILRLEGADAILSNGERVPQHALAV